MSPNPCRSFFERHGSDPRWVHELQKCSDRFAWQELAASRYSPAPVADDEVVCRIAFNPLHWDAESDLPKPTLFSDAEDKGASVERLKYKTPNAIWSQAYSAVTHHNRGKSGAAVRSVTRVVSLVVGELRVLEHQGQRVLGVFDTAKPGNWAHADLCVLVAGKQAFRSVRSQLLDVAGSRLLPHPNEMGIRDRVADKLRDLRNRLAQTINRLRW